MIWIRTQNGEQILDCEHIAIMEDKNEFKIIKPVISISTDKNTRAITLGSYSTYSNAMTVLNDIQEYISKRYKFVYQMPSDDEISECNGYVD